MRWASVRQCSVAQRVAATVVVCGLGSGLVSAEGADERDFLAEVPVVVSATRLAQPLTETPVAVTVLDRALLAQAGVVHLVDALRLVPGMQVGHVNGTLFSTGLRGAGAPWFSRLLVMVDGQSRYHTSFSGLDWATLGIALADVERIEVVRGPNTPAYGDNAVSGSVNIVTRQAGQDAGLFVQGTAGSQDWGQGVVRWVDRLGEMDYRLTLDLRQDTGFDRVDDDTRLGSLAFRGQMDLSVRDSLDLHIGYVDAHLGVDRELDFARDDRRVRSAYQQVRWHHARSARNAFTLSLALEQYDSREQTRVSLGELAAIGGLPPPLVELALGPLDQKVDFNSFNNDGQRLEIDLEQVFAPGARTRLVWGLGYLRDSVRSDQFATDARLTEESYQLRGNLEWRATERALINLGGLVERQSQDEALALSPRLGVNYRLARGHTLRGALARAEKFPSLLSESWYHLVSTDDGRPVVLNYASQGDLALERRDLAEVGYLGQWQGGRLELDARLYQERVRDGVSTWFDRGCPQPTFPGVPCYVVANSLDYRVRGLDLALSFRPQRDLRIRLAYAHAQAEGMAAATQNPRTSVDLADTVPRHLGSLLVARELPAGWMASATAYYVDEMFWFPDGREPLDDYLRLDLRLAKQLETAGTSALFELLVQGLGSHYAEYTPDNRFDRRVFLRVSLQFE